MRAVGVHTRVLEQSIRGERVCVAEMPRGVRLPPDVAPRWHDNARIAVVLVVVFRGINLRRERSLSIAAPCTTDAAAACR